EGVGLAEVAKETVERHRLAFGNVFHLKDALDPGGEYQFRLRGEEHLWTPDSVAKLQHAVRSNNAETYDEYARLMNDQSERLMQLRGLFDLKTVPDPVPLDQVE